MIVQGVGELSAFADLVAIGIRDAFEAHVGPRWEIQNDEERAVTFEVEVPSLRGKTVRELTSGPHPSDEFGWRVYSAGESYVNGRKTGRTLHSIYAVLETVDGVYTGIVKVRDRSSAFDYDL